jgi:hypothetical protein
MILSFDGVCVELYKIYDPKCSDISKCLNLLRLIVDTAVQYLYCSVNFPTADCIWNRPKWISTVVTDLTVKNLVVKRCFSELQ